MLLLLLQQRYDSGLSHYNCMVYAYFEEIKTIW